MINLKETPNNFNNIMETVGIAILSESWEPFSENINHDRKLIAYFSCHSFFYRGVLFSLVIVIVITNMVIFG